MENRKLLKEKGLETLGVIFKSMSEPSRLKILDLLSMGECCVNDLAKNSNLSQSLVSHHLRLLRTVGIVHAHRKGKKVYYSMEDDHILNIFLQGKDHIEHLNMD